MRTPMHSHAIEKLEKKDQLIQRLLTAGLLTLAATLVGAALVLYV